MNPTHDTPQERDDKADALTAERKKKAKTLATELRRFRWETRIYYWTAFVLLLTEIF